MSRCVALLLAIVPVPLAFADDHRAQINYTLHCRGCHLAGAEGLAGEVPRLRNFAGFFLHSREGREFVIRVPGVATASLSDEELAELMNWLLLTFSREQLPQTFTPFSSAEVAALRSNLVPDPGTARTRILNDIAGNLPALAGELRQHTSD